MIATLVCCVDGDLDGSRTFSAAAGAVAFEF